MLNNLIVIIVFLKKSNFEFIFINNIFNKFLFSNIIHNKLYIVKRIINI